MFGRKYHNLNLIEISAKKLIQNYHGLEKKYGMPVAPVLKSNAYGHGIVLVAKILEKERPPFFCVDSLFEAYQFLKAGIKTQILVMGYVYPDSLRVKKLPFAFAVYTDEILETIRKYQPQAPIHIFVDTGMHREGVPLKDLPDFIQKTKGLNVQGLMTHYGIKKNYEMAQKLITPKWIHDKNVKRVGIDLYPGVLTFKSTIAQLKDLEKGDKVGYDFTFTAPRKMKIAVVPAGYNDGVDRDFSNRAYVFVKNIPCKILGRVNMNITTIDVSNVPNVKIGDEVILYPGKNQDCFLYEFLVHLNPLTKRALVN